MRASTDDLEAGGALHPAWRRLCERRRAVVGDAATVGARLRAFFAAVDTSVPCRDRQARRQADLLAAFEELGPEPFDGEQWALIETLSEHLTGE